MYWILLKIQTPKGKDEAMIFANDGIAQSRAFCLVYGVSTKLNCIIASLGVGFKTIWCVCVCVRDDYI